MSALQLTRIDKFAFMAESESLWRPAGSRAVYGGQVFGLAMLAAHETVGESLDGHTELVDQDSDPLPLHSAHSYFLLPGDSSKPILYM
jgi:acyl-CoA thioesterase